MLRTSASTLITVIQHQGVLADLQGLLHQMHQGRVGEMYAEALGDGGEQGQKTAQLLPE